MAKCQKHTPSIIFKKVMRVKLANFCFQIRNIESLADRPTDRPTDRSTDRPTDRPTNRPPFRLPARRPGWPPTHPSAHPSARPAGSTPACPPACLPARNTRDSEARKRNALPTCFPLLVLFLLTSSFALRLACLRSVSRASRVRSHDVYTYWC